MINAFASFSRRSFFLFSLLLGLFQASCGDPCDGAPPPPPFLCTAYVTVFAELPADQRPTISRVGTTITGTCDPGVSAGEYRCSIAVGPWRGGATFDATVEAAGATPQTVTFTFGAPGSSECFTCPAANSVPPVDLRPGTVDLGLHDGGSVSDAGTSPSAMPTCLHVGSFSEGWYAPDATLICYVPCALATVRCDAIGTRSEGWYATPSTASCPPGTTSGLIEWANCAP